ncbi:unnamed protein product [Pleuronectes platessa]|uniref:Uncharacterized protein n=1 Tax=Pleuronectes platessa TaxID=8262 RepID=A0A9N7Z9D1_PLEPL|nr:unnamed protein product [Pleuronectes platessa]
MKRRSGEEEEERRKLVVQLPRLLINSKADIPRSPACSLPHSLTFPCSLLLHCMSPSRSALPFDWEVNGKELEKPTEDSSTKKKPLNKPAHNTDVFTPESLDHAPKPRILVFVLNSL